MAKAYITEFAADLSIEGPTTAIQPPLAEQTVTFTTTTQSSVFNPATRFIRVHADAICSISVGVNPTATTSTARLVAGQTEYYRLGGSGFKIAFVTNT